MAIDKWSGGDDDSTEDSDSRAVLVHELLQQKQAIETLRSFCDEARDQVRSQHAGTKQVIKSLHTDERGIVIAGIVNIPKQERQGTNVEHNITNVSAETEGVVVAGWVNLSDDVEPAVDTSPVGRMTLHLDTSNLRSRNGGHIVAGVVEKMDLRSMLSRN